MESSQVSLNKVMLNISTSKDQGLNLVKGEVLRGVVLDVKADGVISLSIKGQVIEAVSEVPVKPGQQLQLMVEDFRDGRTYLKALTPELLERIENTNLSVNLTDIGVPAKESNVLMARKLLAHNLPVTAGNLNELSKGMNILGGSNARNLELAAFALQRGIPLNQQNLNSLAQFTAPGNALVQLMDDIMNSLVLLEQSSAQEPAATGNSSGATAAAGNKSATPEALPASSNQVQPENSNQKQVQPESINLKTTGEANASVKGSLDSAASPKSAATGETAPAASGIGKAGIAETGTGAARMEGEASVGPGNESSEAKTSTGEKEIVRKTGVIANKAGPEQTNPTNAKADREPVKPPEAKAAASTPSPPVLVEEEITQTKPTGVDKQTTDIRATVKATAAGSPPIAGDGPEVINELPKAVTGTRNVTTGEKMATETAPPSARQTVGEPAALATGKVITEQVNQPDAKEAQALPNATDEKPLAKESNVVMARKLQAHNLPVTTSNLNELSKGMNILGGSNARNLELAAFAMQRGITLNQQNLNSLVQLMDDTMNSLAGPGRILAGNLVAPGNLGGEPAAASNKSAVPESLPTGQKQVQPESINSKTTGEANASVKGSLDSAASPKSAATGETAPAASGIGKAGIAETGTGAARMEGEVPVQSGKELLETKTNAAEKAAADKTGASTNKTNPEPTTQTAGRAASEQVKIAEAKATAASPMPADEAGRQTTAAGNDKSIVDNRMAVKTVVTQSAPIAGDGPEIPGKVPEEGTQTKNITVAEKPAPETARPNAGTPAAEPASSTAGKAITELVNQSAGKESPTMPAAAEQKSPAEAGAQANKTESDSKLPSGSGPERSPGEKQPPPQPSTPVKTGDLTAGKESVLSRATADADGGIPGDKLVKHLDLLKPLLDILRIDASENKSAIGAKLANALYSEKDLIKGLMLLEDIIKNNDAAAKNPIVNDLLQKIDGLEKDLSGQRILNFASRSAVDSSLNYFYFSFPVQMGNEQRLGQIRINKEIGRRGLKNQDTIRFIVSLDTSQMGLVLFHLTWKRSKEIEVQGVVENQKVCNHLTRNIEVLLQGLNGLGYKTQNMGIKVAAPEEDLSKLKLTLEEEAPLNIRPLGIDITV